MNKKNELLRNTIIISIGKICTQFISFILLPLYTGILSTEEYGIVDLVITYTSLLIPILFLQIDQALFRFLIDVRKDLDEKKTIVSTALSFIFVQGILIISIFSIIQPWINSSYKWIFIIYVLIVSSSSMMLQISRGLGDNIGYSIGSVISASTQIVFNILFLVVFSLGVNGMLFATMLGHFACVVYIIIKQRLYRFYSIRKINKNRMKSIFEYSIPLIPNALSWWILNASDRSIVLFFLGVSANGILSVGHKFSTIYVTLYNFFNYSWTESASMHINDSDHDDFFSSVITTMFRLFMCAAILIIALMPFVFHIFIDSKFEEAYGLIPIFMLASMFNVVIGLYSVIYVALKKTKEIAKTSIYSGLLNIAFHLFLVKFIGLYAACISTAIAFCVMAIYRYFDIKKYVNVQLKKIDILSIVLLYCTVVGIFYTNNLLLHIVAVLLTITVSIVLNKVMILEFFNKLKKKLCRTRN